MSRTKHKTPKAVVLSAESIAELIAATHSDNRSSLDKPTSMVQAVIHCFVQDGAPPGSEVVARFYQEDVDVPEWEPDFTEKLEEYLYDKYGNEEEKAESRLNELREGAPLTEEEEKVYEENYYDFDVYSDYPIYYLYRFSSNNDSPYFIYFLVASAEMGQQSAVEDAVGPFRSLDEVVTELINEKFPLSDGVKCPFDFNDGYNDEETNALRGKIIAACQRRQST